MLPEPGIVLTDPGYRVADGAGDTGSSPFRRRCRSSFTTAEAKRTRQPVRSPALAPRGASVATSTCVSGGGARRIPSRHSRWAETGAPVITGRRSGEHRGDPLSPRGPTDATGALMVVISPEQRTEWTRLTDRLSAEYAGYDVTIEVLAPEVGDNQMVEPLPSAARTSATRSCCAT
jgi:hypothetical protein